MALLDIVSAGATDYSCTIRIVDSADGTPETGVVFNTAGIDLWYRRPGAAHTSITEATQTESGAHTDGGFVHISDGEYRLDLPDAAVASGADYVDVGGTVTDMVVIGGRIRIASATRGLAGTALPNAAADAAGGLVISDAGGFSIDTITAPLIADAVWDESITAHTGGAKAGEYMTAILLDTGTTLPSTLTTIDTVVDGIATNVPDVVSLANINAQVVDVLRTDTISEPAQGAPPLAPTVATMINYLYRELVRNKVVVDTDTANQKQIFADDGTTILYEKDLTNASNVTTVAEATTGA